MTESRNQIEFSIPGTPKAKSNQKVVAVRPDGTAKIMNDEAVRAAQDRFAEQAKFYAPLTPWTCPIRLELVYVFLVPWSWPDWKKIAALKGEWKHTAKPDVENVTKWAKDAMEGLFYKNDSQVCEESAVKRYGMDEETRVRLIPLAQAEKPPGRASKTLTELEARDLYEQFKSV